MCFAVKYKVKRLDKLPFYTNYLKTLLMLIGFGVFCSGPIKYYQVASTIKDGKYIKDYEMVTFSHFSNVRLHSHLSSVSMVDLQGFFFCICWGVFADV